jgi:hypothetical protein
MKITGKVKVTIDTEGNGEFCSALCQFDRLGDCNLFMKSQKTTEKKRYFLRLPICLKTFGYGNKAKKG